MGLAEKKRRLRSGLRKWGFVNTVLDKRRGIDMNVWKAFLLGFGIAWAVLCCSVSWADQTIIETLILEARGEGIEGMVAVGEVIRTRAEERGLSYRAVCLQRKQFSCWNDRQSALNTLKTQNKAIFRLAAKAWEASESSNLTHKSNHYHNLRVKPYWIRGKKPVAQVKNHLFYRL